MMKANWHQKGLTVNVTARKPVSKPATGVKQTAPKAAGRAAPTRTSARKAAAPATRPPASQTVTGLSTRTGRGRPLSAASLLGVSSKDEDKNFLTWMEWVEVIRRGVPSTAVDTLVDFLSITKAEFSEAIDIPVRTLVRRKGEARLDSAESAKLVRVARVIERAEEVFEDPGAARVWLKSPNASLSGQTPMSLLDTEIGAASVMDTLGRIEHGVFY
jgi:putative toxin-antitoxin system antitoxin component (TIGR02293 family)